MKRQWEALFGSEDISLAADCIAKLNVETDSAGEQFPGWR
jgi:hypothetical protein